MNVLLVVDVQKEFVTSDILNEIKNYINSSQYNNIVFTIFERKSTIFKGCRRKMLTK